MGMGPVFDGMGLINAIYSYGSEIAISFTSDRDMMPDPANYAQALRDSFDELLQAQPKAAAKPKAEAAAEKKATAVPTPKKPEDPPAKIGTKQKPAEQPAAKTGKAKTKK
jgi:hypothetical protein